MSIAPNLIELFARARVDMRSGVPVVLKDTNGGAALVIAAECVGPARLAAVRDMGRSVLAITRWRAETLKARAYDGDMARLILPQGATPEWIKSVADPSDDLMYP
ncbi:MAG: GTP cyclohydrolase II, partial [Pseudomonadota bacterium]